MGLNIKVEWGEWYTDEYGNPARVMPEDVLADQAAEMYNMGYCGVINLNWAGVGFLRQYAAESGAPNPLSMLPNGSGGNDGELALTNHKSVPFPAFAELLSFRDKTLRPWLRGEQSKKIYKELLEKADKHENRAVDDWIRRRYDVTADYRFFVRHLAAAVNLINFVEIHKDKPNLVLLYL